MSIYHPEEKPYRQERRNNPPVSVYLISDDSPEMDKISCIFCKRTIADIKGTVDTIIGTPMSVQEFDIAVNVLCSLCHQSYRLLVKGEVYQR